MRYPHVTAVFTLALTLARATASAQTASAPPEPPSATEGSELMINGFRTPSIGLEYRYRFLSVHAGAYTTIINEGESGFGAGTWFFKAGLTLWFLPVRVFGTRRSSFYAGASFMQEISDDGWGSAVVGEVGFRLVIWRGIFARLGVAVLAAPGRTCPTATPGCDVVRVNPTPGLGWGFAW
jgi:hypothetical protein